MNRKIVIAIIIAVSVTAAAAAALIFFWPTISDQESATVTTFTNPDIGITIDHPSSWISDLKDIDKRTVYFSSPRRYKEFSVTNKGNQFDMAVTVYDSDADIPGNTDKQPLGEFIARDMFANVTPVSIDGKPGYQAVAKDEMWPSVIFIEANNKVYKIQVAENPVSDDIMTVISNFKFGGLGG